MSFMKLSSLVSRRNAYWRDTARDRADLWRRTPLRLDTLCARRL